MIKVVIDVGYKYIVYISGLLFKKDVSDCFFGYKKVLEEVGIFFVKISMFEGDFYEFLG